MKNNDISLEVKTFARRLESEGNCKVRFKRMTERTWHSAYIRCTSNPRAATIFYDLKKQDKQNIQTELAHEIGHGFLYFRDGFYLISFDASLPDRTKDLIENCRDLVLDVVVDRLIKREGYHPWTPDFISRMEHKINADRLLFSNSWNAMYEILNRRLAREYMTIDEDQVPIFDAYIQACQNHIDPSIIDGVEKRLNLIRGYDIFEPAGNKTAVESLLDLFGITELAYFYKADDAPTN